MVGDSAYALHSGTAAIVDGCLQVGDAIVVWHPHHLDAVEDIVADVEAGGSPIVQIGGGGLSLDDRRPGTRAVRLGVRRVRIES